MPGPARPPRIGHGLYNGSPMLARGAEPYLAVASETLGDLNLGVASLYLQVVVAQLLDQQSHDVIGLPTDVAGARTLPALPDTGRRSHHGPGPRTRLDALREIVEGWGDEEVWPYLETEDTSGIPARLTQIVARHSVPATAVTRRRLLVREIVEPRVYQVIQDEVRSVDQHRATAEMRQALGTLSPQTAIPLLLRPLIGVRRGRPPEQVAASAGVSVSALQKWMTGVNVPHGERCVALDRALDLEPGTTKRAADDQAPAGWPLLAVADVPPSPW